MFARRIQHRESDLSHEAKLRDLEVVKDVYWDAAPVGHCSHFLKPYYGNKNSIYELDLIRSMLFCANSRHDNTRPSSASVNGEQAADLQSHATSILLPAGAHLNGMFLCWRKPRPLAQRRSWRCPLTSETALSCQQSSAKTTAALCRKQSRKRVSTTAEPRKTAQPYTAACLCPTHQRVRSCHYQLGRP